MKSVDGILSSDLFKNPVPHSDTALPKECNSVKNPHFQKTHMGLK